MGRLVILSGPSCVGKTPMYNAFRKNFPDLARTMKKHVLYNSRSPRPIERDGVDYHYRSREHIEELRARDDFIVFEVRADIQALDISELTKELKTSDIILDVSTLLVRAILNDERLKNIDRLSIFISPLSKEEVLLMRRENSVAESRAIITGIMKGKLLSRTKKQKGVLSPEDLTDIDRRAASAYDEMKAAWLFDYVIPNHDGEDSENWQTSPSPVGDAWTTTQTFASILRGKETDHAEKWESDWL